MEKPKNTRKTSPCANLSEINITRTGRWPVYIVSTQGGFITQKASTCHDTE